jgi:hypothetical protein
VKTQRERYIAALVAQGETLVKSTRKYDVYTRHARPGQTTEAFYYVGRAGALRVGISAAHSIPCSDKFKQTLLDVFRDLNVG